MQVNHSYPQGHGVGYNHEPVVNVSSSRMLSFSNAGEQEWKHLLTNIPSSVRTKLVVIGVCYLVIGILSIGLEIGLTNYNVTSYILGYVNGVFLIILAILTFILCRQQIYVLSNLFVVVFFQLMITISTFGICCLVLTQLQNRSSDCSYSSSYCLRSQAEIILGVDLLHCFCTFCLVLTNFVVIKRARRPQTIPMTSTYTAYIPQTQSMQTSFQNPYATAVNQSSLA